MSILKEFQSGKLSTATLDELNNEIRDREANPNPFPLHVFHEKLQPYINAFVSKYDFPREYIGTALLSAYSTCIGTSYVVSTNGKDSVPLTLWTALIGISSSAKSYCINKIYEPITEIQTKFDIEWHEKTNDLSNQERLKIRMENITIRDAHLPTIIRSIIPQNPKGVTKIADEIIEWVNGMGQLSKKEGIDEQFWLSSWNGKSYQAIRADNIKISLHKPCLGVVGGIQPKILYKLFANDRDISGFVYRMLFAIDPRYKIPDSDPKYFIPDEFSKPHFDLCNSLWADLPVNDVYEKPKMCIVDGSSLDRYYEWKRGIIHDINIIEDINIKETKAGLMGKMTDYVLRFAALLTITDIQLNNKVSGKMLYPNTLFINLDTMNRAIELGMFYYRSGQKAFDMVERSTVAPIEVIQMAALIRMGKSYHEISKYLYNDISDKGKAKAYRTAKNYMRQYPKVFNAIAKK